MFWVSKNEFFRYQKTYQIRGFQIDKKQSIFVLEVQTRYESYSGERDLSNTYNLDRVVCPFVLIIFT